MGYVLNELKNLDDNITLSDGGKSFTRSSNIDIWKHMPHQGKQLDYRHTV